MSESLSHHDIEELLGAYALDAVDPDERELVERHLATCPRCRAEVADHREVAALIGHGGTDAPAGVWDRIVATLENGDAAVPSLRVHAAESPRVVEPPPSIDDARRRRRRAPLVAIAAAAAAVIAVLAFQVARLSGDLADVKDDVTVAAAAGRALDDPTARHASLLGTDGDDLGVMAVVTEDGEGFLFGQGLPALDDGIYQLWGVSGESVVSLGVLGPDPGVTAFAADPAMDSLVVTAEDAPVVQSEQPAVVAGDLA